MTTGYVLLLAGFTAMVLLVAAAAVLIPGGED